MKHLIFSFILISTNFSLSGQSVTATYEENDIPTSLNAYDPDCNGFSTPLQVTLPAGSLWQVTGVDIEYSMTAQGGGWKSHQRSQILFQNTNITETNVYEGTGNSGGIQGYNRTGVTIANGIYPGNTPLVFEMHAWRTAQGSDCDAIYNKVNNFTWIMTVYYQAVSDDGQAGIGTVDPDSSAILELKSFQKGFLPPRMTMAFRNAIPDPAEGLIIYCTDCNPKGIYNFTGSTWQHAAGSGLKDTDGDTYIGVEQFPDEDKIRFVTSGTGRMIVSNDGKIGLGTTSPLYGVHIIGNGSRNVSIADYSESSGDKYGLHIEQSGSSEGKRYGLYTLQNVANDSSHVGATHELTGSGTGERIGMRTILSGDGGGTQFGTYNSITNSGDGIHAGSVNGVETIGTGPHYGTVNSVIGSGEGEKFGVYNLVSSNAGTSDNYAIYNELSGEGMGKKYGIKNNLESTGEGEHYGVQNTLSGGGGGPQFGVSTTLSNSGGGEHYGSINYLDGNGQGSHTGTSNILSGFGEGIQTGTYNGLELYSESTNERIGTFNSLTGYGLGTQTGSINFIDGMGYNAVIYGTTNTITHAGGGHHEGVRNELSGSGPGEHFGINNILIGSADGDQYGVFNTIAPSGNAQHFGIYNLLEGEGESSKTGVYTGILNSGAEEQRGTWNVINTNGDGDRIGVHNMVFGTGNASCTGTFNDIFTTTSAMCVGVENSVYNLGTGTIYGTKTYVTGNNVSEIRGLDVFVSGNGTGTKYGVFSEIQSGSGGTGYAGYFNGDVTVTGTFNNPSDQKFKTNIHPASPVSSLEKLKAIRIYQYDYDRLRFPNMSFPQRPQTGVIAQELQGVFPELVKTNIHPAYTPRDENDSREPSPETEFLGVDYMGLIPHLINAVQEQQRMIDELKEEIRLLRNK